MLYIIRNVILISISLLPALLLVWVLRTKRKLFRIITPIIVFFVILLLFSTFPVENLFVDFETPETVFAYTTNGEIQEVVHGQASAMVIYKEKQSTYGNYIVPMGDAGYKLPSMFTTTMVSSVVNENCSLTVYTVSGTEDYYITGFIDEQLLGETIAIYNGVNEVSECTISRVENTEFVCFYVHDLTDEHYIVVGNNKLFLKK